MKKLIISIFCVVSTTIFAQVTTAYSEAETIEYVINDSVSERLPKEVATLEEHKNKVSRWSKLTNSIASVAGAAGTLTTVLGVSSESLGAVKAGATVASASSVAGRVADTANDFGGIEGKDVVIKDNHSPYMINYKGGDLKFVIKTKSLPSPEQDMRIIYFSKAKEERRIQWMNYDYGLLASKKAAKGGYKPFYCEKCEEGYIITIPEKYIEDGEYAIATNGMLTMLSLPASTFGIKKI